MIILRINKHVFACFVCQTLDFSSGGLRKRLVFYPDAGQGVPFLHISSSLVKATTFEVRKHRHDLLSIECASTNINICVL